MKSQIAASIFLVGALLGVLAIGGQPFIAKHGKVIPHIEVISSSGSHIDSLFAGVKPDRFYASAKKPRVILYPSCGNPAKARESALKAYSGIGP